MQSNEDCHNPLASPDLAEDVRDLPPVVILTEEHDPLRVEAEAYSQRLIAAGVPVISQCIEGVVHGFFDLPIYEEEQKILWLEKIRFLLNSIDQKV